MREAVNQCCNLKLFHMLPMKMSNGKLDFGMQNMLFKLPLSLTSVSFSGTCNTIDAVHILHALILLPHFTVLNLSGVLSEITLFFGLLDFACEHTLTDLDISHCGGADKDAALYLEAIGERFRALKRLNISFSRDEVVADELIAYIQASPTLQWLDIRGCPSIRNAHVKQIESMMKARVPLRSTPCGANEEHSSSLTAGVRCDRSLWSQVAVSGNKQPAVVSGGGWRNYAMMGFVVCCLICLTANRPAFECVATVSGTVVLWVLAQDFRYCKTACFELFRVSVLESGMLMGFTFTSYESAVNALIVCYMAILMVLVATLWVTVCSA